MENCYWWIFSKQQEQQQQKFQIKIALKVAKNTISDTRQKNKITISMWYFQNFESNHNIL